MTEKHSDELSVDTFNHDKVDLWTYFVTRLTR